MLCLDMLFKVMTFEIYTPQWSQVYPKGFLCLLFLWRVKFLVYFAFSSHWLHMRCFNRPSWCHFSDSICFLLLDFITMYAHNYYIYLPFFTCLFLICFIKSVLIGGCSHIFISISDSLLLWPLVFIEIS